MRSTIDRLVSLDFIIWYVAMAFITWVFIMATYGAIKEINVEADRARSEIHTVASL